MENTNQIKKALYKEKQVARRTGSVSGTFTRNITHFVYTCKSSLGEHIFTVPVKDYFDADFQDEMPAQLLIRWLAI